MNQRRGAGCTLGDIIAEFAVFGLGATVAGLTLGAEYIGDYLAAVALGIVFQYFAIAPIRGPFAAQGPDRGGQGGRGVADRVRDRAVRLDGADDLRVLPRPAPAPRQLGFRRPMPLSRRIFLLAAAVLMAVGAVVAFGAPAASAATQPVPPGLGGRNWTVIPAAPKVAALTFDAGANADGVSSILATLARYHVPATFFLTGDFVRDFPAASKSIAAAGERIWCGRCVLIGQAASHHGLQGRSPPCRKAPAPSPAWPRDPVHAVAGGSVSAGPAASII